MEHYNEGQIHFVAPLEKHEDFCMSGIVLHALSDPVETDSPEKPMAETEGEGDKVDEVLPLITPDECIEECLKKDDADSSSASSFEEVTRDDCSTSLPLSS